jgi:hypothetical protein
VSTRRYLLLTLLLFTALTTAMTFPQVLHMRDSVHDDGDPLLNAWTLSWVAHQLPRAPAQLFDANIFYPERRTLAFSETLLLPAVVVAPLHWLGAGPILVHNIVLLSGFILSGVGMAFLVRTLTANATAGVLAGLVFAFLPYRVAHYPHMQLQQTQCLPFAMWAFHRLLSTGRVRDGVLMGIFTAGQMLSCVYYGLFLMPYMAVVGGALFITQWHRTSASWGQTPRARNQGRAGSDASARRYRVFMGLLVAAAIVCVAVVPVGIAYLGARQVVGERTLQEVVESSATWRSYLAAPAINVMYGKAFARFVRPESVLFPGFVAVVLAIVALLPRRQFEHAPAPARAPEPRTPNPAPEPRTRFAYALGLILAVDVSLGFNGFSYGVLYDYFLPFRGLRAPARMGVMVGFSLAVLAGYGAARISDRVTSRLARRGVLTGIGVLILMEYMSRPIPLQPIPRGVPEVYADMLRDRGDSPDAAIVEYPMSDHDDPTYMYYSTFHWQYLVNGYSGFFPPSYREMLAAAQSFPDAPFIDAIKARGVRYLLVHQERMIGTRYVRMIPQLDRRSDLILVSRRPGERYGQHGEISLYRVVYAPSPQ